MHRLKPSASSSSLSQTRIRTKFKNTILFGFVFLIIIFVYFLYDDVGGDGDLSSRVLKFQWKSEFSDLNGPDIHPLDPRVILKLKDKYLFPPSSKPLNTTSLDPSMGQSEVIVKVFHRQPPGFFIECGALDGETRSNTLMLEQQFQWKGLLIEADPVNFIKLTEKSRHAWSSNTCLSTTSWPQMVSFKQNYNQGKIAPFGAGYIQAQHVDVQCFPFSTYMEALNISVIDYFSLDVEGLELEILKTIDFKKYNIKTLSVEFIHGVDGKEALREYMKKQGYFVQAEVTHPDWLANDFIFVKREFYFSLSNDVKLELERTRGNG